MKPIVNEMKVKFIQCPECKFEKSSPLYQEIKRGAFAWFCPKCGSFLMATVDENGNLTDISKGGRGTGNRFVMISLPNGVVPHSLFFSLEKRREEELAGSADTRDINSKLLILNPEPPDGENNPQGVPQFRAIVA